MKRKSLVLILTLILAVGMLTGCGGTTPVASASASASPSTEAAASASTEASAPASPAAEPVKIEFFQQKPEEGPQKGYQQVIDSFRKEFPNIEIEMNTVPDAAKVLTARISSNDIPPMFSDYPTQMQFKQKVANGFVEKISGQEFLTRINASAITMSKANDGETYALPLSNNFMGIYYNMEIFEKQGVKIPQTLPDLLALCRTLKDNGVEPLAITAKEPGRAGHMFQAVNTAWNQGGVETIAKACEAQLKIADDNGFTQLAGKVLSLTEFANADMFSAADTAVWENFANGKYAMLIAGSYARGTLLIANPNLKMGIFPIPNDTVETTNILTGVDAAICMSATATDAQKDAALKFMEFISRTENAQVFCDSDGAPSCVTEVVYKDSGLNPVIDLIKTGRVHDWMASTVPGPVVTDLYNVYQGFLMDKNPTKFLEDMDKSIAATTAK